MEGGGKKLEVPPKKFTLAQQHSEDICQHEILKNIAAVNSEVSSRKAAGPSTHQTRSPVYTTELIEVDTPHSTLFHHSVAHGNVM